jgi:hypothetical protein
VFAIGDRSFGGVVIDRAGIEAGEAMLVGIIGLVGVAPSRFSLVE